MGRTHDIIISGFDLDRIESELAYKTKRLEEAKKIIAAVLEDYKQTHFVLFETKEQMKKFLQEDLENK
jgi:hypothetical protein